MNTTLGGNRQPDERKASLIEAVTMLRQRLSILENARQFGGSVKLESRIARTRTALAHALAIRATPTTEERVGDIVIRDDANACQVVIKFPSKLDDARRLVREIIGEEALPHSASQDRLHRAINAESDASHP